MDECGLIDAGIAYAKNKPLSRRPFHSELAQMFLLMHTVRLLSAVLPSKPSDSYMRTGQMLQKVRNHSQIDVVCAEPFERVFNLLSNKVGCAADALDAIHTRSKLLENEAKFCCNLVGLPLAFQSLACMADSADEIFKLIEGLLQCTSQCKKFSSSIKLSIYSKTALQNCQACPPNCTSLVPPPYLQKAASALTK